MPAPISIHSPIRVMGHVILGENLTDFPASPQQGQLILKNNGVYGYINVGGNLTWYPLVKEPDTYQHNQATAATEWVIAHNLNNGSLWYQVQDDTGQIMTAAGITIVDANNLKLTFSEAVTGKALIMGTGGERGQTGERGLDGASAYQVAVNNGFVGTEAEWLASLQGAEGPVGPAGATGPQGPAGGAAVFHDNGIVNVAGTTLTIDYGVAQHERFQVGAAMTMAFANWPVNNQTGEVLLEIDNAAAFTITWPTINWMKSDGTFTTNIANVGVSLQATGKDFVLIWTRDNGATLYGKIMR